MAKYVSCCEFKYVFMSARLAKIVSYIFHPVFVPTLGIYYILSFITTVMMPEKIKWFYLISIFIFTGVFPILTVVMLSWTKQISSIEVSERKERRIPLLMSTIYFYFATYIVFKVNVLPTVSLIMFASAGAMTFATLVSFFYKMSMHVFASSSFIAIFALLASLGYFGADKFMIFFILMSGIVASARKALSAHSWMEILVGFLVGFGAHYILLSFLLKLR